MSNNSSLGKNKLKRANQHLYIYNNTCDVTIVKKGVSLAYNNNWKEININSKKQFTTRSTTQ